MYFIDFICLLSILLYICTVNKIQYKINHLLKRIQNVTFFAPNRLHYIKKKLFAIDFKNFKIFMFVYLFVKKHYSIRVMFFFALYFSNLYSLFNYLILKCLNFERKFIQLSHYVALNVKF